jgi:hypothetical protein
MPRRPKPLAEAKIDPEAAQLITRHAAAGFVREVALANMVEFVRRFKTVPISRG